MPQQAHVHMKGGNIFTLCLLVHFSPLVVSTKCAHCPAGAAALSPWDGFVVACKLLLWKLLFIPAAGFMVLLKGSFKSALICSSAIGFSSKECSAGGG